MKKENKGKKFTPIHNMPPPLYGPPEIVHKEVKKETEENTFFVEENILPCVYGPPERKKKNLIQRLLRKK